MLQQYMFWNTYNFNDTISRLKAILEIFHLRLTSFDF